MKHGGKNKSVAFTILVSVDGEIVCRNSVILLLLDNI